MIAALPAPGAASASAPKERQDGWTGERRATFLAAVAEGHTVEAACAEVGLSVASAYALRRRAGGEAFALGWRAACLLARDRLVDMLTSRAIDGQVDTYTRADGSEVTRHRHDNRLALALLTRLDRLAERPAAPVIPPDLDDASPPPPPAPEESEAARLAAEAFPRFLEDVVADDAAEAGALDAFVTTAATARNPQLPQLPRFAKGKEWLEHADEQTRAEWEMETVWDDEADGEVLTSQPPPAEFAGIEYGRWGDRTYARTLTYREMEECGYLDGPAEDGPDGVGADAKDRVEPPC